MFRVGDFWHNFVPSLISMKIMGMKKKIFFLKKRSKMANSKKKTEFFNSANSQYFFAKISNWSLGYLVG